MEKYDSAIKFLDDVEEFLLAAEVENNLPLGVIYNLVKQEEKKEESDESEGDKSPLLARITRDEDTLLVLLRTPPRNLILVGSRERQLDSAVSRAVSHLAAEDDSLPGVIGVKETAEKFARSWQRRSGGRIEVSMEQRLYRLEEVKSISKAPGRFSPATEKHLDIVQDWIVQFADESLEEEISGEEARKKAIKQIEENKIYLWLVEDEPVSMAASLRSTPNVVAVGYVYTPPGRRRQGYATSAVAELSRHLLEEENFSFCCLFTDLANPTSNSIYRKIGYRPVVDFIQYKFINE